MADIRIFVVSLGYGQVSMGTPHGATSDLVKSDLLYGQNSTTRRFCPVAIFTTTATAYQILPYLAFIILFFSSYVKFGGQWAQLSYPGHVPQDARTNLTTCTMRIKVRRTDGQRAGVCPRNFSECVQKSITVFLYHNILCLSTDKSTCCIWTRAHLYKVPC